MRCQTPAYIADPNRLISNLDELRDALRSEYRAVGVAYSVKTNPLALFITRALDAGFHPEVVSEAELDYVIDLGADPSQVILNGPSKTGDLLARAIKDGVFVNVDSIEELETVADLGLNDAPIGVRIAATLASGETGRFGVDLSVPETLDRARELTGQLSVVGIHIHHSSERSADSYVRRLENAVDAAAALGVTQLDVVDVGGGFASNMPDSIREKLPYPVSTFGEYGTAVGRRAQQLFGDTETTVILEPGIGVLADTMAYVCTVQAVKERKDGRMAMLDGSIFEVNPLRSAIDPPARLIGRDGSQTEQETLLYGATCMEVDQLGRISGEPQTGDRIMFDNIGAYGLTLAPDFIVPRSPVIDLDSGRVVRDRHDLRQVGGRP